MYLQFNKRTAAKSSFHLLEIIQINTLYTYIVYRLQMACLYQLFLKYMHAAM